MSKHFSNKVQAILERRSRPSIRILMEEEGDKEEEGGLFDMPDEADEETEKEDTSPDSEEDSKETDDEASPDENTEEAKPDKETQLKDLADQAKLSSKSIESMNDKIKSLEAETNDVGVGEIQDHILKFVESASRKNNLLAPLSIKNYLSESTKEDLKFIEKNIETYQNTLDKSDAITSDYGQGKEISVLPYVDGAVNALEHFDNLFSKEGFIIQAVANLLILITGAKAKEHIEEFKDEFAKALSKKDIVYDDRVIKNFNYKNAAGAKSTG